MPLLTRRMIPFTRGPCAAPSSGSVRSAPPASMLAASLRGPQDRRQATLPDAGPSTWITIVPYLFRYRTRARLQPSRTVRGENRSYRLTGQCRFLAVFKIAHEPSPNHRGSVPKQAPLPCREGPGEGRSAAPRRAFCDPQIALNRTTAAAAPTPPPHPANKSSRDTSSHRRQR